MLRSIRTRVEKSLGLRISRISSDYQARVADLSLEIRATIKQVGPYTMTSLERLAAVCMAVEYVVGNEISGAFVECGVWRGGSSMAAALTYQRLDQKDVDLFLFDTFEGMSQPGPEDFSLLRDESAAQLLAVSDKTDEIWCYAAIDDVRRNMESTGYRQDRIHLLKGMVEETIPKFAPEEISILRLDTDWYESTMHELVHLFPRLSKNGILIIDDYGYWAGARKAVDEYFATHGMKPFLGRLDCTGRIYLKS